MLESLQRQCGYHLIGRQCRSHAAHHGSGQRDEGAAQFFALVLVLLRQRLQRCCNLSRRFLAGLCQPSGIAVTVALLAGRLLRLRSRVTGAAGKRLQGSGQVQSGLQRLNVLRRNGTFRGGQGQGGVLVQGEQVTHDGVGNGVTDSVCGVTLAGAASAGAAACACSNADWAQAG